MVERSPGVWRLRAWDPVNKRQATATFRGERRAAGRALAAHVADTRRTAKVVKARVAKSELDARTVADAFRLWANKGDVEGASIAHGRYSLRYLDGIKAVRVTDLTSDQIKDVYRQLLAHGGQCPCTNRDKPGHRKPVCPRGKRLAKSTVIRVHGDLHAVLEYATEELHWLEHNPAHKCAPKAKGKKQEARKTRPPTDDEVHAILEAASRRVVQTRRMAAPIADPRLGTCLHLAADLGARAGEQCGLRWPQVNLDRAFLIIDRTIAIRMDDWDAEPTMGEKPYPKNDTDRVVALSPLTVKVLREYRKWQESWAAANGCLLAPDAYLFSRFPDGREGWRPNSLGYMFRQLCKALDIDGIRLHDMRAYMATTLLDAGVSIKDVQALGGWEDERMLLRLYAKTVKDANRRAADIMAAHLTRRTGLTLVPEVG